MGLMRRVESRLEKSLGAAPQAPEPKKPKRDSPKKESRLYVQPGELAAKLVEEMDHRKVSDSGRSTVSDKYTVYLCAQDYERLQPQMTEVKDRLRRELAKRVSKKGYQLSGQLQVQVVKDDELALGKFGILAENTQPSATSSSVVHKGAIPPVTTAAEEFFADDDSFESDDFFGAEVSFSADLPLAEEGDSEEFVFMAAALPFEEEDAEVSEAVEAAEAAEDVEVAEAVSMPAVSPIPVVEPVPVSTPASVPAPAPGPAAAAEDLLPTIVVRAGDRVREFSQSRVLVGRGRDADFRVDDPNVSRHHASIYLEDGHLMVQDLKSTNGTMVNGYPVTKTALRPNDVLVIGDCRVTAEARPREEA